MEDEKQVEAYSLAGRIDGVMAAAYLFHTAQATCVIRGARRVIDLACGPATQLTQIASFNPESHFVGIDLSSTMLAKARAHVAASRLQNVTFCEGSITDLSQFKDKSVDAVISTMALHHLPEFEQLHACFRELSRVLKPGGAVYLTDFGRLKSLKSVKKIAYMNADMQPEIFSLDYERSLRAAFLYKDLAAAARHLLPESVCPYRTFMVPLLVILRTPARPLPATVVAELRRLRDALPARYRSDLEDLRLFFRFGGLSVDPFIAA